MLLHSYGLNVQSVPPCWKFEITSNCLMEFHRCSVTLPKRQTFLWNTKVKRGEWWWWTTMLEPFFNNFLWCHERAHKRLKRTKSGLRPGLGPTSLKASNIVDGPCVCLQVAWDNCFSGTMTFVDSYLNVPTCRTSTLIFYKRNHSDRKI